MTARNSMSSVGLRFAGYAVRLQLFAFQNDGGLEKTIANVHVYERRFRHKNCRNNMHVRGESLAVRFVTLILSRRAAKCFQNHIRT